MNFSVILPFLVTKKRIYTEHLEKQPKLVKTRYTKQMSTSSILYNVLSYIHVRSVTVNLFISLNRKAHLV